MYFSIILKTSQIKYTYSVTIISLQRKLDILNVDVYPQNNYNNILIYIWQRCFSKDNPCIYTQPYLGFYENELAKNAYTPPKQAVVLLRFSFENAQVDICPFVWICYNVRSYKLWKLPLHLKRNSYEFRSAFCVGVYRVNLFRTISVICKWNVKFHQ